MTKKKSSKSSVTKKQSKSAKTSSGSVGLTSAFRKLLDAKSGFTITAKPKSLPKPRAPAAGQPAKATKATKTKDQLVDEPIRFVWRVAYISMAAGFVVGVMLTAFVMW